MSDSNPNNYSRSESPRNSGIFPTDQERRAEEERQQAAAQKKADDAREDRAIRASEVANDLSRSNRNLTVAVVILTAVTAGATAYQVFLNRKSWDTAKSTLVQIQRDSESSSRQFMAQLEHNDAHLGVEQVVAGQAIVQAQQTLKLANNTHELALATRDTADTTVATVRPWLGLSLKLKEFWKVADGYSTNINPVIDNIGVGVAEDVNTRIELRIPSLDWKKPPTMFDVAEGVSSWCDSVEPAIRDLSTIFPKETRTGPNWNINITQESIRKSNGPSNGLVNFIPMFYGCTMYRFGPSKIWHRTAVVYQITVRGHGGFNDLLMPNQDYSLSDLSLEPFVFIPERAN